MPPSTALPGSRIKPGMPWKDNREDDWNDARSTCFPLENTRGTGHTPPTEFCGKSDIGKSDPERLPPYSPVYSLDSSADFDWNADIDAPLSSCNF
ncbi:hypothetical protein KM043_010908 [Ampulex compressa]|nr:hypothetical protein KM043_010908 [Ampulex compressa]